MPKLTLRCQGVIGAALVAILIVPVAYGVQLPDVRIAEAVRNSGSVVVIREGASPVVRYAAEEFIAYVSRATGVRLQFMTDSQPLAGRSAVLIGPSRHLADVLGGDGGLLSLGDDGFRIVAKAPHVAIVGSDRRGALYGVYAFLERFAGCRWYASWRTVVPRQDGISVPRDFDETQVPSFEKREVFWFDPLEHPEFAARLRMNARDLRPRTDPRYGLDDYRFGEGMFAHTLGVLMPADEFFDGHPDYFCLVDGRREKSQLCLSHPEVLKIVTERMLDRIRQNPSAKFFTVSQNDNVRGCTCPACKAVDEAEESRMGTMVRFVNAVGEAVEREFPEVVLKLSAYQYTRKPPKLTKVRRNVMTELCTLECDFSRPIGRGDNGENAAMLADLAGWSKLAGRFQVWDYTTNFNTYQAPFANIASLQDNIRLFRDHGVRYLFEQGAYQGRHGEFAELKAWLLAKWMWNPDLPARELISDFLNGYYGAAAPFVRQYLQDLHRCQRDYSVRTKTPLRLFDSPDSPAFDEAFYVRAADLWAKAAAAVQDDRELSYNVRMSAFAFDCARVMHGDRILTFCPDGAARMSALRVVARSLLDRMKEAGDIVLSEMPGRDAMLIASWRDLASSAVESRVAQDGRGEVEERFLELSLPGQMCELADDPEAGNGRAVKLFGTHYDWCVLLHLNRLDFNPGRKYVVSVRVRIERSGTKEDGEAFWTGFSAPGKAEAGKIAPRVSETKDGYQWYDLNEIVPGPSDYLWFAPGHFTGNGTSAVKAVWLDKVAFRECSESDERRIGKR